MAEKDHSDKPFTGAGGLGYVPLDSIRRLRETVADPFVRAAIVADICRINTLYMITFAGSSTATSRRRSSRRRWASISWT